MRFAPWHRQRLEDTSARGSARPRSGIARRSAPQPDRGRGRRDAALFASAGVTRPRFDLRYRPAAFFDLEDIFRGVVRVSASPVTAQRYVARIRQRCRRITLLAARRAPARDLAPGLRSVPSERRAVIIYRVSGETVEITNIFHGGRDYAALDRRGQNDDA